MSIPRLAVFSAIAFGLGLSAAPVHAQTKITPTQVYSVVQATNSQLEELLGAALLPVPAAETIELSNRRPRHVFQKARAVFEILQTVRKLNGLQARSLPAIPGRDLTPVDVKQLVDSVLSDTNELAGKLALPAAAAQDLSDKKSPTDVYRALLRSLQLAQAMDVPPPLPNDVYRVADTIVSVTQELARHRGLENVPDNSPAVAGKKPGDVYKRGADLLTALRDLNGDDRLVQLPAGVVEPTMRTGRITPAHVNDLLGMVLADLVVAKVQLGIEAETEFRPPVGGMTPSDVFERLETAHTILTRLQ